MVIVDDEDLAKLNVNKDQQEVQPTSSPDPDTVDSEKLPDKQEVNNKPSSSDLPDNNASLGSQNQNSTSCANSPNSSGPADGTTNKRLSEPPKRPRRPLPKPPCPPNIVTNDYYLEPIALGTTKKQNQQLRKSSISSSSSKRSFELYQCIDNYDSLPNVTSNNSEVSTQNTSNKSTNKTSGMLQKLTHHSKESFQNTKGKVSAWVAKLRTHDKESQKRLVDEQLEPTSGTKDKQLRKSQSKPNVPTPDIVDNQLYGWEESGECLVDPHADRHWNETDQEVDPSSISDTQTFFKRGDQQRFSSSDGRDASQHTSVHQSQSGALNPVMDLTTSDSEDSKKQSNVRCTDSPVQKKVSTNENPDASNIKSVLNLGRLKSTQPSVQKFNCAIHLSQRMQSNLTLSANSTHIRTPSRPLPFIVHNSNVDSEDKFAKSPKTCDCKNSCGPPFTTMTASVLERSLDIREAGLIDIREGEKLHILGVYMEPRILVRNVIGEYGLVKMTEIKGLRLTSDGKIINDPEFGKFTKTDNPNRTNNGV